MRDVEVVTELDGGPERVWEVLIDFAAYPSWAAFVRQITGRAEVGSRLEIVLGRDERRPVTVRPVVVDATRASRLAWQGRLGPPGLFGGTHEFVLTALPDNRTRLLHRETFHGVVAALFPGSPRGAVEGFAAFNAAIARRVASIAGRTTAGGTPVADPEVDSARAGDLA